MARSSLKNVCRLIEQANNELPVEQSFLADLKRSIELDAKKSARIPSKTYKPSSMKCIRNMYYQRIGAPVDSEPQSYCLIGICNAGSDIHERIQKAVANMRENGADCEYIDVVEYVESRGLDYLEVVSKQGMETKLFHKKLGISFLCDGIIKYNGHYYILELKTEASFKWNARTGVDSKHYAQGTAYSTALQINDVIFVYINRDVLDMKAYMFTPTDDQKQELIGKIDECESYVKKHITPPMPTNLTKSDCNYCSYKTVCKKD